ncbi:MAG: tRNA pseudouridine(55) synthase TruB [Bacteroidales bacterium]|jgi:tRNA pseudouridine55 synthase|nr:tRNA pseudouridine(55) synthase TruB [Bacteroidales bacterium]
MSDKPGLIIPIDKPLQWTSFQVVNKVKWHLKRTFGLKKFKIGHAGTLDPLASGLLLVCVGSATRQIESLQQSVKTYAGTMLLGATTPCYDLERAIDAYYPYAHIDAEAVERVRSQFTGTLLQQPPQFSAVKVDGQRAYSAAREGAAIEPTPKEVTIYSFNITDFRPGKAPSADWVPTTSPIEEGKRDYYRDPQGTIPPHLPQLDFRIECSKGTYIRSIARDMGQALGSGALLTQLRRLKIGDYDVDNALPLLEIEQRILADSPEYQVLKELA